MKRFRHDGGLCGLVLVSFLRLWKHHWNESRDPVDTQISHRLECAKIECDAVGPWANVELWPQRAKIDTFLMPRLAMPALMIVAGLSWMIPLLAPRVEGHIDRSPLYFMGKTMVPSKLSLENKKYRAMCSNWYWLMSNNYPESTMINRYKALQSIITLW